MSGPILTVDLGNSRLKLCVFAPGEEFEREPLQRVEIESDAASLAQVFGDMPPLDACGFSSVADIETTERIAELCRPRARVFVETTDHVLENGSTHPSSVGTDRLFAALGALHLAPDAEHCIVVDAGTALTVDVALRAEEAEGNRIGSFLGGAIAAGPELCARALARGGARLIEVEPRANVRALGRNTREAIESGVVHGLRGAARELVTRMSEEVGDDGAPIFLTGGASGLLQDVFEHTRVREVRDLVHIGLLCAIAGRKVH